MTSSVLADPSEPVGETLASRALLARTVVVAPGWRKIEPRLCLGRGHGANAGMLDSAVDATLVARCSDSERNHIMYSHTVDDVDRTLPAAREAVRATLEQRRLPTD